MQKKNWYPLDNAAKIYPPNTTEASPFVFSFTARLASEVDPEVLQKAVNFSLEVMPTFKTRLKRGIFWYYLESNNKLAIVKPQPAHYLKQITPESNNGYMFEVFYRKNTVTINNNSAALEAQILALEDRIARCRVVSPVGGTVLVKYAEVGELATMGKPLFKVADLDKMYLRAYFTSEQLSKVKLGDTVKVIADFGAEERFEYEGTITWIASESEFTPKTIQTKDSRANLVYAVKIAVKNDGRL